MIRFGPLLIDHPRYQNPGALMANNVLPKTQQSYGPFPSLQAVTSNALNERCQGAAAFKDVSGNVYTFAADDTDLWRIASGAWSEISKSTAAYAVAAAEWVQFTQFGQVVIAAMGHGTPLQAYTMGVSSDFADLGGTPPRAKCATVVEPGFVFLGNTWDASDGSVENRVWWSAIDNAADWPTIGSADAAAKQSDQQDIAFGGPVQAVLGAVGGMAGAIFQERSIQRIAYEGPPTIFGFYEVERGKGTPAPNSVVGVGRLGAFYLGDDGFYSFNAQGSSPIGAERIDQYFYDDLDQSYYERIYGAADIKNKVVYWLYPGSGNSAGIPNKVVAYNWALDRWTTADVDAQVLLRDYSAGYTLDELDAFGNMDTLQFSLDSSNWAGGQIVMGAVNSDKKLAWFTGQAAAATLETGENAVEDGEKRAFVRGIRPFTDADDTDLTVTLKYREGNSPNSTLSSTAANAIDFDGHAHFTTSARYASTKLEIAAGALWTHAQGINYDLVPDGEQ